MKAWNWKYVVAAAALALCGCAEKLTYQRWQTLQVGDSPDVVKATFGAEKLMNAATPTWTYHDPDRGIVVEVFFTDGKITRTTWNSPEQGMEAKGEQVDQPGEAIETRTKKVN